MYAGKCLLSTTVLQKNHRSKIVMVAAVAAVVVVVFVWGYCCTFFNALKLCWHSNVFVTGLNDFGNSTNWFSPLRRYSFENIVAVACVVVYFRILFFICFQIKSIAMYRQNKWIAAICISSLMLLPLPLQQGRNIKYKSQYKYKSWLFMKMQRKAN